LLLGVAYSTDGETWRVGTVPFGLGSFAAIAYGAGRFVAVGDSGQAAVSADGITWALATTGVTNHFTHVSFARGLFVAAGDAGRIITSPDGLAWTSRTTGTNSRAEGLAYYAEKWQVIGSANTLFSSADGVAWTRTATVTSFNSNNKRSSGLAVADGALVMLSNNSALAISEDVNEWAYVATGGATPETYTGLAEGNGSIILVGYTSVAGSLSGVFYQSRSLPRIALQPVAQAFSNAGSVLLSVRLTNDTGVTYQWRKDGIPISGATVSDLTVPAGSAAATP
jgi:hypothetical protein